MANPLLPGPLAGGAESLVGAFMGGDATQAAAQQKAQLGAYQLQAAEAGIDKKMTDAFLARDKRKALQGVEAQYVAAGDDPIMAALKASAHIGGFGNIEQAQRFGLRDTAHRALQADPNFNPANAALGALAGKPIAGVANVDGQNVTGIYGDAPVIANSDKTASTIVANRARAGASNAQAGTSNARTRLIDTQTAAGGWNPNTGGGGGKPGKPPAYTAPTGALMKAFLSSETTDENGDAVVAVDPAKMQEFSRWQQRQAEVDPAYRNGNFALAQFKANKPAMRDPIDFGAGEVTLPADADPEGVVMLRQMILDRRQQGLPEMSNADRINAILEHRKTGGMRDLSGVALAEPVPEASGNVDAPRPSSKAEFDRLASGTRFIAPDGTTRVKP